MLSEAVRVPKVDKCFGKNARQTPSRTPRRTAGQTTTTPVPSRLRPPDEPAGESSEIEKWLKLIDAYWQMEASR